MNAHLPSATAPLVQRGPLRGAAASRAYLFGGGVATAAYFALPARPQAVWYVLIGFSAVAALVVGPRRYLTDGRLPWYLFAGGIGAWAIGDAIFDYYDVQLGREPPLPSVADVLYLAGYPLLAAGLVLLLRQLGVIAGRVALVDAAIMSLGLGLVQWIFVVDPYTHETGLSLNERIFGGAYPAMDILLLAAFAQMLVSPAWRLPAYQLLIASFLAVLVADELYAYYVNSYTLGSWIDLFFLVGYVLVGAAALHPSMATIVAPERRSAPRLTTARFVLLSLALLTVPFILLIERSLGHRIHATLLGVAGVALATLALIRLVGLVRNEERARRAERQARREAENAQRLLSDQNRELRELDRLKDEFVSLVSHDLRTPLTSIVGYVDLILDEPSVSDEHREYLAIVARNTKRLHRLVDDLLFAARLQAGRLELDVGDVDLVQIARHTVETLRPRAEAAGVDLALELGQELNGSFSVLGESSRLAQLLDNLVSTAVKFTPSGGRVAVRVARTAERAVVEVRDSGIGIPQREQERLFERFFRSSNASERQIEGTGLGLYITKAIVEAHKGRIDVESHEGQGTTFRVELPLPEVS
jgi:signal transduction histidine kinase